MAQAPNSGHSGHQHLSQAILEALGDAVVSVTWRGIVTSWNLAAEALYGYSAGEMIGRSVEATYGQPERLARVLERVAAGETVRHPDMRRLARGGGELVVDQTFSPLRDGAGSVVGVVTVGREVSEIRRVEAELAAARVALERNNARLQRINGELEQFAYVASHDLSEPLRAIAGMVQLLGRRYRGRLDSDADEFITFATEGCERMRAMIDDLLSYSRAGRSELGLAEVEVGEVLDEVLAGLRPQMDDTGATVERGQLPRLLADRSALRQVLQNLINNAIKFGGEEPPVVEVTARRLGDGWRIDVADTGIGIDAEYRERIFRMFQRLHVREVYAGNGIGLAIAERLVTRRGGRIWVEGRPGRGSIFAFTIPDDTSEVA